MAVEARKADGISLPGTAPTYFRQWRSRRYAIVGLLVLLVAVAVLALGVGSADVPLRNVWKALLSRLPFVDAVPSSATDMIIMNIRLPRILLAGVVGAALAVAGATYQGLFRNPLADPYFIGVSQGAWLGAIVGFLLPWSFIGTGIVPLLAFCGAVMAVSIVYFLTRVGRTLPMTTMILGGVAVGAFLASISSYLMIVSGNKLHGMFSWLMGQFSLSNWEQVWIATPYIAAGTVLIWLFGRSLNVLQLGEEQAKQLGLDVERTKLILLGAATLMTAAAVSFAGTIGFVGIIVPHAVRLIWGPDHRYLVPLSALSGAVFLVLADTLARTMLAPTEVPVGVITAFIGAPFFLYLLRQKKRAVF